MVLKSPFFFIIHSAFMLYHQVIPSEDLLLHIWGKMPSQMPNF